MPSQQQLEANRANAQLSTGPTSSDGKAKVSHNALKTGLTGRTVLLPTEDVAVYQAHNDRIFKQFSPETDEEKRLTQSIADTLWRLERIPSLEMGIYAIGRRELASQFADEQDETVRKAMIEAQIFLTYRRELSNLSLQEARLRRLYEKDTAELKCLIAQRQVTEPTAQEPENARATEIGFEFSTEEAAARARQQLPIGCIKTGSNYEEGSKARDMAA